MSERNISRDRQCIDTNPDTDRHTYRQIDRQIEKGNIP